MVYGPDFFLPVQVIQFKFFFSLRSIQMSIFLELFQKNSFFTIYIHISKGHKSLKNCSIDLIFFLQVQNIPIKFFLSFESYHFLKIMSENVKKLNFVAAILDFWRPSWTDNGYFLTLYSLHGNDHLYKFW